ncbi:MAG: NUDIX hydrolase [Gammaproteobacteria bacterium]|nr:NUDIX hydrolase [Gammaproteobacteria bacterium]
MATRQTPLLTVDIIIELVDRPGHPIVLIRRKYSPPGLAFPGGFVDRGETVAEAAIREAAEETSLTVNLLGIVGVFSDPSRDQRGHTVSVTFVATATGEPAAADDAGEIILLDPGQAPPEPLAFDHALMLERYRDYRYRQLQLIQAD